MEDRARSGNAGGAKSRGAIAAALLAGVVMLGVAALLASLYVEHSAEHDECLEAGLLDAGECARLHDDPATLFLAGVIAALIAVVVAAIAIEVRRRRGRDGEASAAAPAESTSGGGDSKAPLRVCPVCSAQARTASTRCPHCGSSYIRSPLVRARRRLAAMGWGARLASVAAVALLLLAAVGAAAAVIYSDDRQAEAERLARAEEERRELEAEREAAEEAAAEAAEEERLERRFRKSLVKDLERSITKDARKESGRAFSLIDGPILDTQCDPKGGVVETDAVTQSFSCLAITRYTGAGARGYRYSAEVNYEKFSYRWRLGGGL